MNDKLAKLWNSPLRKPLLIGVVAFNAGIGIGYILGFRAKDKLPKYTSKALEEIIVDSQNVQRLARLNAPQEKSPKQEGTRTHRVVIDSPVPGIIRKQILAPDPPSQNIANKGEDFVTESLKKPPEQDLVTRSIFANDADNWNYELEVRYRQAHPDGPYVLHKDEFYENEQDLTQVTLTYYSGDNIMVDEEEKPIYNHEQVTGPMKFGYGSGDPNVFHVRNLKRKAEYEILKDPGLYSVEVLGLEIEDNQRVKDIKHANSPGKFRPE